MPIKITEITVGLGTGFNHPYEMYANFKPSVTIKATCAENEDGAAVVRELQKRAYDILAEEKRRILGELERKSAFDTATDKVSRLETDIANYETILASPDKYDQYYVDQAKENLEPFKADLIDTRAKLVALS